VKKLKLCHILAALPIIKFFWNILLCQLAKCYILEEHNMPLFRVKQSKQKDKNPFGLLGSEVEGTTVLQYVSNYIPVDKA
jgi:hypothetical protein